MDSILKNTDRIGQMYLQNSEDLIFVINEDSIIEYSNSSYFSRIKNFHDFIFSDDCDQLDVLLKDIFRLSNGTEIIRIKQHNDQLKWYEIKGYSFIDDEDNNKKAFLVGRDITKYKKIELEYEKSQARFGELTTSLPEIKYWKLLQSKKGLKAVQKTIEMLELVIEHIPQLIYWKDTNLVYLGCNSSFASINNLNDPSSIIGKIDDDLHWFRRNLDHIKDTERKVITNDEPEYNIIESLETINGEQAWFEINRIPLHDAEGKVVGLLATYEDISIRKLGEQKIRESEKKYRSILENIKESYFEVDLKGTYTFFNDAFCELLGEKRDNLMGKNYQGYTNEESKNEIFEIYNAVFKSGNPNSNYQSQFIRSNGEEITCESSVYLRYDSNGNKIGFSGLTRNITEKFYLLQKIKQSEEKYHTIFNASPDYIYLTDSTGNIVDMNPALLDRTGMTLEEAQGVNFSKFYAGEDINELTRLAELIRNGKEIKEVKIKAKTKQGEIFEFEVNSVPLKEKGKVTAILNLARDITLRKKTEEKLRESEKKYRHLFESSTYSIILINRKGVIVDCNPATKRFFRREIEDLIGKNFMEVGIKPENMLPLFQRRYQANLKGDVPDPLEIMINRSGDGSEMWINVDESIVEIGGEDVFQVIVQDITKNKIAEQKLKNSQEELQVLNRELEQKVKERTKDFIKSERQYRTTIDSLGDPLHVVDKDLRIILINEALKKWLIELNIESSIVGRKIPEVFPFLPSALYDEYLQVFDSGIPLITIENTVLPDFKVVTETRKIPIFIDSNVSQVITIIRDITDKRKIEDQLKESEENFRNMITNLDEGYYKIELAGKILYHNPAFSKIAGYDPNENLINKQQPFIWQNLEDQKRYKEELLNFGHIRNYTIPVKRKDGEIIFIHLNARLIRNDDKEPISIEGTFMDVTEKFKLEQELMLSERKLRLQNVELKKLDKVKNDFITMAAHELKTPLISISGYTDYILLKHRSKLNSEITDDLLTVKRNVSRLEILMDQLLDVLKIDENELKLQKEKTNVSKIINDCLDELSYLINEKNLEVILKIDREIILNIDATRIFSVFTNLISNAIKFTPDYGWIEIDAKKMENQYLFELKDNGIGLSETDIEQLFQKFVRIKPPILSKNINIKDSGTGLGLYITRGIINAHGGEIQAYSEGENKGSKFSFTLPL